MAQRYMETVLTPAVKAAQERFYHKAEDYGTGAPELDPLTPREHDFITTRDSFTWLPSMKMVGLMSNIGVALQAS